MFNPFDLPGPEFLVFYFCFASLTIFVQFLLHFMLERNVDDIPTNLTDPYKIAVLGYGRTHAVRVAVVSLIDRQLLKLDRDCSNLCWNYHRGVPTTNNALESAIRSAVVGGGSSFMSLLRDSQVDRAAQSYEDELGDANLLYSGTLRTKRCRQFLIAFSLLVGVAMVKLSVAILRGRTNVGFLLLLAGFAAICSYQLYNRRLTRLGKATVQSLKSRYSRLLQRAPMLQPAHDSDAVAFLVAVFGVTVLPPVTFPFMLSLLSDKYFTGKTAHGGCSGGGCSGGGGCGGGGCGGGCGGCG